MANGNGNGYLKKIGTIFAIIVFVLTCVWSLAVTTSDVKQNRRDIQVLILAYDRQSERDRDYVQRISEMRTMISTQSQSIEELKGLLREHMKEGK